MSTTTHKRERSKKQVEIDEAVLERVKRGLAWLEETHGPGWEDKIDLKTLDLQSGSHCVLGQVYHAEAQSEFEDECEGFFWASAKFGLVRDGMDSKLGFDISEPSVDTPLEATAANEYSELQKAWEHVLTPRMSKRGG